MSSKCSVQPDEPPCRRVQFVEFNDFTSISDLNLLANISCVSLLQSARNDIPPKVEHGEDTVPQEQAQVPPEIRHEAVHAVGVVLLVDVVAPVVVEELEEEHRLRGLILGPDSIEQYLV